MAHRQAAGQLVEIFGEAKLQQQGVEFAQTAGHLQTLGPAQQLFQGRFIGRDPGEAVGGVLLGFEELGAWLAGRRDTRVEGAPGGGGIGRDLVGGGAAQRQQGFQQRRVGAIAGGKDFG